MASECADGGFENNFLNALSIYYLQIDQGGNTPYQQTKTVHRSGKKQLYYNWHIRSTWDVLHQVRDEVAGELGFVKNSNAMFMGAALEEMSQKGASNTGKKGTDYVGLGFVSGNVYAYRISQRLLQIDSLIGIT